ncbi:putative glycosyltransferase EpsF [compost metagenome]
MDVFVLPSLFEGLGLVNVEAQASGLPTIVADTVPEEARVSDLMEVLPLAVSEEAWAEHIVKYAKGYTRRDTLKEVVRCGYDIRETAEWLEAFYLNARPRRSS